MKNKCLLILLLQWFCLESIYGQDHLTWYKGAITRGDTTVKNIYLVFTGDEYAEGGKHILSVLKKNNILASFFFTGRFYAQPRFKKLINQLKKRGHYLGAHSDAHLLYCDWNNRDSLLVTHKQFNEDLLANYDKMQHYGIHKQDAAFFLPPYEWYNDSIAAWTRTLGLQLINYTPGTLSHADYTIPADKNYRTAEIIYESILSQEKTSTNGLNGFILLMHIGTDPQRDDKFYYMLQQLTDYLRKKNYHFKKVTDLLPRQSH